MRLLTGAQGSMGIVTWVSIRCELVPAAHKLTFVPAKDLADLVPLAYRFCRLRLGDELFVLDRTYLARLLAAAGEPAAAAAALPAWVLVLGLAGREHYAEERVAVAEADARALAKEYDLTLATALPDASASTVERVISGIPSAPWKLAAKGGSADVFFLTTLDKAPGYIATARELAASLGIAAAELGVYIQPQHQGVSQHVELSLPYDPNDTAETQRARAFFELVSERLMAAGAYFSRPYGSWAQPVYNRDAAARDALRKVKAIFDPAGVMNPGKLCFGAPSATPVPVGSEAL
jgi:FAD/FMN-containing dehydrogenase